MQDYAGMLGIPNLPKDTMPQIWPGGFTESLNVGGPSTNVQEFLTLRDDVTRATGTHAFKWGYELMRNRQNQYDVGNPSGTSWTYVSTGGLRTNGTALPNTGITLADFMVGAISFVSFNKRLNANLPRSWEHSFYVQDDWKVTPSLTLNLGIRYILESPPVQKYGLVSIFDPNAADDSVYTNYTCPAGGCKGAFTHPKGAGAYNRQWNRFDPRFGVAWHPLSRLVLRGGFAVNHVDMRFGYLYTDELMSASTSLSQTPGNPSPLFYLDNGPPRIVYPTPRADGSIPYSGNVGGRVANMVQQDLRSPYALSWNFGAQYEVSSSYMVELQYKGSAQVHDPGSYDLNELPFGVIPNPNGSGTLNLNDPANAVYRNAWLNNPQVSRPWPQMGNMMMNGSDGHMTHHEGMVKIEKRFSKGLNFLAFYTLQKTLMGNAANSPYLDWHLNKARASYDQRHNFSGTMTYEIPVGKGRKFMNRGGWLNYVFGDFDFVWTYTIASGQALGASVTGANTQQYPAYMPSFGSALLLKRPTLRDNWQDLGGNRFNQNAQNPMIDCGALVVGSGNDCLAYVPSFSIGNTNAPMFDGQRIIAATMSASKEIPIKERLRFLFRFDFQNPFKWYNWGATNAKLDISSVANAKSFGTTGVTNNEATTAAFGGQPIMNITLAFKW
jgi:hypothetical protein